MTKQSSIPNEKWESIAGWSYGLSRAAMDYLQQDNRLMETVWQSSDIPDSRKNIALGGRK